MNQRYRDPNYSTKINEQLVAPMKVMHRILKVWEKHLEQQFPTPKGRGKRPSPPLFKQFELLVLNLLRNYQLDKELGLSVPLNKTAYTEFNSLSSKLIEVIHAAHKLELFHLDLGIEGAGRISRIWPTDNLVADLDVTTQISTRRRDPIVLGYVNPQTEKRSELSFADEDYEPIKRMREELNAYQDLLDNTFIEIGSLDKPVVIKRRRDRETGTYRNHVIVTSTLNNQVRRIFYRGSWDLGGRFHGGFWQQVGSQFRKDILINDVSTIEADYSGLHLSLCYPLAQVKTDGEDPYAVDLNEIGGHPIDRETVKMLTLQALNAKDDVTTYQAFRRKWDTGSWKKKLTNQDLSVLLDAIKERHAPIAGMFCTDQGVRLMKIDGNITARIINHFTKRNIPILSVHDSYIVPNEYSGELRSVMNQATLEEIGIEIDVKQEGIGIDQYRAFNAQEPFRHYDMIKALPKVERTEGYKRRLAAFQERVLEAA